jgi:hypothetical protein
VQEVFSQAWRQASRYEASRGNVAAWLMNLARSRAIDRLRARARRPDRAGDERAVTDVADAAAPADLLLLSAEQIARAGGARRPAAAAARGDRARVARGLTHTEIAERLEQPLGTVKDAHSPRDDEAARVAGRRVMATEHDDLREQGPDSTFSARSRLPNAPRSRRIWRRVPSAPSSARAHGRDDRARARRAADRPAARASRARLVRDLRLERLRASAGSAGPTEAGHLQRLRAVAGRRALLVVTIWLGACDPAARTRRALEVACARAMQRADERA